VISVRPAGARSRSPWSRPVSRASARASTPRCLAVVRAFGSPRPGSWPLRAKCSMPDAVQARGVAGATVTIVERQLRTALDLRGDAQDPRFLRAVESVTDLRLPLEPGTSAAGLLV